MKRVLLCFLALSFVFILPAAAQESGKFRSTDYPLPRFASVGQDKSYVRTGPGSRYPIKWVFKKKYLPVEIVLEFDNWRKIVDYEGEIGWMHLSQLSGRRSGLVKGEDLAAVYSAPTKTERMVAYLEPNVVVRITSCGSQWCLVDAEGYKGWIEKERLWGVYEDETIRN